MASQMMAALELEIREAGYIVNSRSFEPPDGWRSSDDRLVESTIEVTKPSLSNKNVILLLLENQTDLDYIGATSIQIINDSADDMFSALLLDLNDPVSIDALFLLLARDLVP